MHQPITCLNGQFIHADRAMVPLTDRGFRFGDGVFETIRLQQAVPYQFDAHIARLMEGLAALKITLPKVDWHMIAQALIRENHACDGFLRIAVSRGSGGIGYLPATDIKPIWAMEYLPSRPLPAGPCRLWLSSYTRSPLSTLPGNQKLAQGVTSTLALLEAHEQGCDEALLLTPQGIACSAAAANLFWISGKSVFTPPLSTGCLAGITREQLLTAGPVPIHEQPAECGALLRADALFLTNTRYSLWPVAELKPNGIHYSADHPIIQQLHGWLQQRILNYYSENKAAWESHS